MSLEIPGPADFDRFARFYDADYRNYLDDLQMVVDCAHAAGERALELGCGTGRAVLPLAAVGHRVTGVDLSPALLGVARKKVAQQRLGAHVELVQDDMRTVRLAQGGFDFVFCVSNTLMHLPTQDDQLAALSNAARHLRPGGFLLVDLFNPDIASLQARDGLQELADQWHDEGSGATVLKWSVRRIDIGRQQQETLFVYEEILADGTVRRTPCPFTLRFLWPSEGKLLLQLAGFQVEEIWGDFEGGPYDSDSDRLIFLATRSGER